MEDSTPKTTADTKPWGMEEKTFLMLMHLSQLTGYILPGAGLVLPIVMWATNKDAFPEVDRHGKNIFNWMISMLIYFVVCMVLMFIFIGLIALVALMIVNLIFIILAAVKANDGQLWPYPLSIKFFKTE
ncbi:hypothetical protein SAMN02745866_01380 [Alteromonadaceae bacterium Bs31]|nr:hypothetical protein SAMN02745866_01380 [Alteromonadaceae bacterium Bs31]